MARNDVDNRKVAVGWSFLGARRSCPILIIALNNGLGMGGKLQTEMGQLTGTKDMVRC